MAIAMVYKIFTDELTVLGDDIDEHDVSLHLMNLRLPEPIYAITGKPSVPIVTADAIPAEVASSVVDVVAIQPMSPHLINLRSPPVTS
jgi:hypothetical protein